jgi:hypothetical protein
MRVIELIETQLPHLNSAPAEGTRRATKNMTKSNQTSQVKRGIMSEDEMQVMNGICFGDEV